MKKKTLPGILLLVLAPFAAWVGVASAQSFRSGDNVTVAKDQSVNSTLWASGKNLDIAGTVGGDVFCAGQNVTISGTVNGDIICAAQTIRISGIVNGDVRLAAQSVTLSSRIADSASVAAQTVSLEQTGSIGRDASIAAQDITLNGTVQRDAALTAGNIILASSIGRNVKARVEHLRLDSRAEVGGSLTYTSHNQASIVRGAMVANTTQRYEPPQQEKSGVWSHIGLLFNVYMVVSLLLLALAAALLLPRMFHTVTNVALREPLKVFLVGLVASLLFPALFIVLLFTIVGVPLALFLLLIWLVILAFAGLSFDYYIGRLVLRGQRSPILIMLVGALVVLILSLIPILDFLVFLAAVWMGVGMVLLRLRGWYVRPMYNLPPFETARSKI